jgi:hypothetical protein
MSFSVESCGYISRNPVVRWLHAFCRMPGATRILRIGGMSVVLKNGHDLL